MPLSAPGRVQSVVDRFVRTLTAGAPRGALPQTSAAGRGGVACEARTMAEKPDPYVVGDGRAVGRGT